MICQLLLQCHTIHPEVRLDLRSRPILKIHQKSYDWIRDRLLVRNVPGVAKRQWQDQAQDSCDQMSHFGLNGPKMSLSAVNPLRWVGLSTTDLVPLSLCCVIRNQSYHLVGWVRSNYWNLVLYQFSVEQSCVLWIIQKVRFDGSLSDLIKDQDFTFIWWHLFFGQIRHK